MLSLRLVRSLRMIRGHFRRFPIRVVPPLEQSGRPACSLHSHNCSQRTNFTKCSLHRNGEQWITIKIIFPQSRINSPSYKTSKMITRPFFVVENLNNIQPYGSTTMRGPCSTPTAVWNLEEHVPLCAIIGQFKFTPRTNNWLPTRGKGHILSRVRSYPRPLRWKFVTVLHS